MGVNKQKITLRWWKMADMYRRFAKDYQQADFGQAAATKMYLYESTGVKLGPLDTWNGFALGKKWMDVTVAMWRVDIQSKMLRVEELQADGFPDWFLARVGILPTKQKGA